MLARGIWGRERLRQNGEYTGVLDQSERGHGTLGGGRYERGRKSYEGIDWMAKLAEDTLISNVTIPGTHDSAAYTYSWPFVQTQNMDIATQLNAGIRYFDLRCGLRDEILEMVHGSAFLGLTLTSVLDTLCAWLSEHESEALIVQIKQDRKPERSTVHFAQAIWKCLSKNSARWRTANTTPTLAELRGKIQLLRRFEGPSLHAYGIDVTRWQDNPSRPFTIYGRHQVLLTIQDHYSFPDPESLPNLIATKGGDVAELLNRAAADPDKGHWYINFTSAYEFNLYYQLPPREVAIGGWWAFHWEEGMNPRIRGYLEQHTGRRRYGIVAMDFPEKGADDLIKTLIMSNFGGGESDSRTILQLLVKVVFHELNGTIASLTEGMQSATTRSSATIAQLEESLGNAQGAKEENERHLNETINLLKAEIVSKGDESATSAQELKRRIEALAMAENLAAKREQELLEAVEESKKTIEDLKSQAQRSGITEQETLIKVQGELEAVSRAKVDGERQLKGTITALQEAAELKERSERQLNETITILRQEASQKTKVHEDEIKTLKEQLESAQNSSDTHTRQSEETVRSLRAETERLRQELAEIKEAKKASDSQLAEALQKPDPDAHLLTDQLAALRRELDSKDGDAATALSSLQQRLDEEMRLHGDKDIHLAEVMAKLEKAQREAEREPEATDADVYQQLEEAVQSKSATAQQLAEALEALQEAETSRQISALQLTETAQELHEAEEKLSELQEAHDSLLKLYEQTQLMSTDVAKDIKRRDTRIEELLAAATEAESAQEEASAAVAPLKQELKAKDGYIKELLAAKPVSPETTRREMNPDLTSSKLSDTNAETPVAYASDEDTGEPVISRQDFAHAHAGAESAPRALLNGFTPHSPAPRGDRSPSSRMTLEGTLESIRVQTEQLLEINNDFLKEQERWGKRVGLSPGSRRKGDVVAA